MIHEISFRSALDHRIKCHCSPGLEKVVCKEIFVHGDMSRLMCFDEVL